MAFKVGDRVQLARENCGDGLLRPVGALGTIVRVYDPVSLYAYSVQWDSGIEVQWSRDRSRLWEPLFSSWSVYPDDITLATTALGFIIIDEGF